MFSKLTRALINYLNTYYIEMSYFYLSINFILDRDRAV